MQSKALDDGLKCPEAKLAAPLDALEVLPEAKQIPPLEALEAPLGSPPPVGHPPSSTVDLPERPRSTVVAPLVDNGSKCKDLERQLANDVKTHGEEHITVAKTLLALGVARREENKIDAAIMHLERALGILESVILDPRDGRIVIMTLSELASCCTTQGRLDDSTALLSRAVEVAQGNGYEGEVVRLKEELKNLDVERRQATARCRAAGGTKKTSPILKPPSNRPTPKQLFP